MESTHAGFYLLSIFSLVRGGGHGFPGSVWPWEVASPITVSLTIDSGP